MICGSSPIKPKCLYSKHKHKFRRDHVMESKVSTDNDRYMELVISCMHSWWKPRRWMRLLCSSLYCNRSKEHRVEGGEPKIFAN